MLNSKYYNDKYMLYSWISGGKRLGDGRLDDLGIGESGNLGIL